VHGLCITCSLMWPTQMCWCRGEARSCLCTLARWQHVLGSRGCEFSVYYSSLVSASPARLLVISFSPGACLGHCKNDLHFDLGTRYGTASYLHCSCVHQFWKVRSFVAAMPKPCCAAAALSAGFHLCMAHAFVGVQGWHVPRGCLSLIVGIRVD